MSTRDVIWTPTPEAIERANVTRLMRAHGIETYPALVLRSQNDIGWFWDAVVKDLDICFDEPYDKVFDDSEGIAWTTWFINGKINIATACVDRWRGSGRVAIRYESEDGQTRTLTYDELAVETARFAGALRELGVRKGDAVGLFLPMCPEAVVAFMAICKLGAIVVPIFSGFAAPAIAARLIDAQAKVLVCADGFVRRGSTVDMQAAAREAAATSPRVDHVVVLDRLGRAQGLTWSEAMRGMPDVMAGEPTDAEDPFLIGYTSGTTGKPKGAVHVHGGFLVKIAAEVAYQTDYQPGEVLWWFTDMGWIMGPWQVVGTLALGGTVFLYDGAPDRPGPDRVWDMVQRHQVNILGLAPTLVRALMTHGPEPVRSHDLSSLRILGSTGEPWNDDPYRFYAAEVGGGRCPVINFSGGTEVGACFLSPTPVVPLKVSSLGGPALGMAIDVFGPDGRPVRGDVGELVCTRPWPGMTRGIWGDPDRYMQAYWSRWPDVWVHGDWASIDADGQWFLHGRSDDTLNVAGKRIGPAEVESVLVGHPQVTEAAVVGLPDDVKGETIHCFVVSPSDGEELRGQLSDLVAAEVGKAFRPGSVRFVDELPKTRNAKVLRRAVRAVALGKDPGDLTNLENPTALEAIARAR